MRKLLGHRDSTVTALEFSADGRILASAFSSSIANTSDKRTILLWDVESGEEIRAMNGSTGSVITMAFHPDGHSLAAIQRLNNFYGLVLWNADSGREIERITTQSDPTTIAFSPDGKLLAIGTRSGHIEIRDLTTGTISKSLEPRSNTVLT